MITDLSSTKYTLNPDEYVLNYDIANVMSMQHNRVIY